MEAESIQSEKQSEKDKPEKSLSVDPDVSVS